MSDYDYVGEVGYDDTNYVGDFYYGNDFDFGGSEGESDSSSGNRVIQYDDGSSITIGADGAPIGTTDSPDAVGNSAAFNRALAWTAQNLGPTAARALTAAMRNPGATLGTALAAVKMMTGGNKVETGGYNKPIPKFDVVREQIQYNDPNRRPGEAGRQYFTNTQYVPQGNAEALAAAQAASAGQASGIKAAYQPRTAATPNPYAGKMKMAYNPQPADNTAANNTAATPASLPVIPTQLTPEGGIPMAKGGIADAGRYLRGKTDGMADEIETSIDEEQPALLSHGEFVIPADVVSHLGNGNSEAGAEKLYEMMDRIRIARTGTAEQGKEINPDKFIAGAGGLAAAYASGGAVQKFNTGNLVTATPVTTPTPPSAASTAGFGTSASSQLSPWAGEYVTNYLGQGAAMAATPYQAYQGPLTAGASDLQQQAFAGSSEMAQAGYTPTQFSGGLFDTGAAQQYMNPYLQASLDPQLKELNRQSQIARLEDAGRLTKAGAYGGSRQAIMESEGRRNLLDKQAGVLGTGYATAYDKAMQQFNADQGRQMEAQKATEASRQYGADFGLKSINQLSNLGAVERGITSEGLAADKAQFEEQRDFAYKMPQYQKDLLQGLPVTTTATTANTTELGRITSQLNDLQSLYDKLAKLGQTPN